MGSGIGCIREDPPDAVLITKIESDQINYRERLEEIHASLRDFFDTILGCEPTPECKEIGKPPLSAANFSAHYIDGDADIRSLLSKVESQLTRRGRIIP